MRLHFPSVAVGVAALAVILASMSQANPPASQARIEYGPHPRDMVHVKEGTPLTVPAGRIFVLTAVGNLSPSTGATVRVNGSVELVSNLGAIVSVPTGFAVQAGSTFEVIDNDGSDLEARAWGYLANQ